MKLTRTFVFILVVVLAIGQAALISPTPSAAQGGITIDFDTIRPAPNQPVPVDLRAPVLATSSSSGIPTGKYLASAYRVDGDWAEVTIAHESVIQAGWEIDLKGKLFTFILQRNPQSGQWGATLENAAGFQAFAATVPPSFKAYPGQNSPALPPQSLNWKFAWTNGQPWFKTQGWHPNSAIDFQPITHGTSTNHSVDFAVLAPTTGTVSSACSDNHQESLMISTADGATLLIHLDYNSIRRDLFGKVVAQGQYLGHLYAGRQGGDGTYRYRTNCGLGTGIHLHWGFPATNLTVNGHNINDVAYAAFASTWTSSNARIDSPARNVNLLANADFSNTTHIRPWTFLPPGNNCAWAIYGYPNGALSTHRPGETNCASVIQDVTANVPAGEKVTLSVWGIRAWDGPVREGRLVLWPWGTSQGQVWKSFTLGPSKQCLWVSLTLNQNATGFRAEIYLDSIGMPDYTFDDFNLVVGTRGCPPGMPTIQSPAAGATVGKTFNVVLQAGAANATGKMDWHVQVDDNADFSSPVFDNGSTGWSTSTTIPVTVPSSGTYWVRARQGDGVDMASEMTAPVQFTVGNSPDTIGVFRSGNHMFYFRTANSAGNPNFSANFGLSNDLPIVGDWNGDGISSPGVFRAGRFYLTNKVSGVMTVDYNFLFGVAGDIPVAGDWNGDGRDEIGVYRPSLSRFYFRNSLAAGTPDNIINFGIAGDRPLVGDWNNDKKDTIGVWRPGNQTFYLSNAGCFNCSATVNVSFRYGILNDLPFVGDWDGNGTSGVGVFRPSTGMMYLRNPLIAGTPNLSFRYGINGDKPVAGRWAATADEAPIFVPKQ